MSRPAMVVETVGIGAIVVGARLRASVNEDAVSRLVDSIGRIGLKTPLSVRHVEEWTDPETGEQLGSALELVTGRHRLEALRRMAATSVPVVMVQDETEARLWEIAENLHRAELSPVDRAEHIDEWRRLTAEKGGQVAHPSGGAQPHDRGHEKTADVLGVSRRTVHRAEKIAALPQYVRDQAREEGWTQDRLLKAATPDRAKLAQIAAERSGKTENKQIDRDIGEQAAAEFAEWLISHGASPVIPQIVTWLEATKTKDIIRELHRQSAGASIMDAD